MTTTLPPDWETYLDSWTLAMEADSYPATTIRSYTAGTRHLAAWILRADPDVGPTDITRDHVRGWMRDMHSECSRSTVRTRLAGARHYCGWLVSDGETDSDPSRAVKMPPPPEQVTPVVPLEQIAALLDTCKGKDFVSRRDEAIIRLLFDSGPRLAEITGLTVADVDVRERVAYVQGKGSVRRGAKPRVLAYGSRTARALDRYQRVRRAHPLADLPALWLGGRGRGPITAGAIKVMLHRRGAQVGVELHPHMARHTWAHQYRRNGGSEGALKVLGGWRNRVQLDRYGASAEEERAREEAGRYSLGDKL